MKARRTLRLSNHRKWENRAIPKGKRLAWLLLAAVVLIAVTLPARAKPTRELFSNDQAITSAVKSYLHFEMTPFPNNLDVNTSQGIVTLSGSVNNILDKRRAVHIAESVRGVLGVVDLTVVTPEVRPDQDIRKDVLMALLNDPATTSYQIAVSVMDNEVTLTGKVGSLAESQLAQRVAEAVPGVKYIRNELTVNYAGRRTDAEIAADVRSVLHWDIWLDDLPIQVTVQKGRVMLAGTVASASQKTRAKQDAEVSGVLAVDPRGLKVVPTFHDHWRQWSQHAKRTDSDIAQAIRLALRNDPRVSAFDRTIFVTVEDHTAILDGSVENLKAKSSAGQDAFNIVGVAWVDNVLAVRPSMNMPSDTEADKGLQAALHWDPALAGANIQTAVVGHIAYLNGTVDSLSQKAEAYDVASRIRGIVEIRNYLTPAPEPEYFFHNQPINDFETFGLSPHRSDAQIKKDIERAFFWSPFVHRNDITVQVEGGVARLTGTVGSWIGYEEADRDAREGGAREVINELNVD
ncbi:MAG TPA: BON domain-containing protein [Candidatus Sulfopaludibacter sp.]|nr:BON domain-containing protein [Candidatus Sulfopaludibacter sp.]